jgi:hypothetical protein
LEPEPALRNIPTRDWGISVVKISVGAEMWLHFCYPFISEYIPMPAVAHTVPAGMKSSMHAWIQYPSRGRWAMPPDICTAERLAG